MSPMLKKVEKAGIKGLKRKRKPYNLLPEHFFDEVETLQKNFSNLINCKEHKRVAIIPSVSITASDSAKEGLGKPNAEPEGLTLGGDRNTSRGPGLGGTSDA